MVTKKTNSKWVQWNHKSNVCVSLKNQCLFKVSMAHEMDQRAKGSWPCFCKYLQDMREGLVISVRPVKSVLALHWYTTWHVSFCCCEHAVVWTTCLKGTVLHTGHFNYKLPGWQYVVFLSGATLVVFGFSVVWLCVFVVFACFCRVLVVCCS